MPSKIFLISPVARSTPELNERIRAYVAGLEATGAAVHWPARDTVQQDETGGLAICRTNFKAIMAADEVHIWYDETSGGSKFDMGGVFMLVEMLGWRKRIIIPNAAELASDGGKSFLKVMQRLIEARKLG
jgi:hypothetical protein